MAAVNLQLPADLVSLAKLDQGDVSEEAAKMIALVLFREDKVSLGRAAELCQTPLEAFMEFAAETRSTAAFRATKLEEDRRTAERLNF